MPLAAVHGKNASIFVATTDASSWLTEAAENWAMDLADTTVFGAGAQSSIPGYPGGGVTLSGPLDATQTTGGDAILAGLIAGSLSVPVSIMPQGAAAQGNQSSVANMFCSHFEPQDNYNDIAKMTSSWVFATKMDPDGLVIQPNSLLTAPGSFPAQIFKSAAGADFAAASALGGIANLHVIQNSLTQTLTVALVHDTAVGLGTSVSVTGGGFTTIPAGTLGSQSIIVPANNINRYVGITATMAAGGTGTVTMLVTFGRFSY